MSARYGEATMVASKSSPSQAPWARLPSPSPSPSARLPSPCTATPSPSARLPSPHLNMAKPLPSVCPTPPSPRATWRHPSSLPPSLPRVRGGARGGCSDSSSDIPFPTAPRNSLLINGGYLAAAASSLFRDGVHCGFQFRSKLARTGFNLADLALLIGKHVLLVDIEMQHVANGILVSTEIEKVVMGRKIGTEYCEGLVASRFAFSLQVWCIGRGWPVVVAV
ncbi:hypothetical protein Taro_010686 [Colocasia esculenta]|uniref:Uncharacterized protein n=1 Tax=Colocasia esculenta TaxID=4460 RepID=A0A843U882_COLES|nr:hypothetical protein [Colocasia esculenta]